MKTGTKTALPLIMGAAMAVSATVASAADLEFYFPVGVNAPAVATIEHLTNAVGLLPAARAELPPGTEATMLLSLGIALRDPEDELPPEVGALVLDRA